VTVIAEVREYSELVAVLKSYQPGPDLPLFSPVEIRTLGKVSLGAVLAALGLKLTVVVDEPQLAKIRHRLVPRKGARWKHSRARRRRFSLFRGKPEIAKRLHAKWMAATTAKQRSEIARHAARARWGA